MAEKIEDLNLPNSTVQKIIKEVLPDNVNLGKDARSAVSRAASVFVLYVTSQASKEAQKSNRKTLLGPDIINALEELEFESFIEPLQEALKEFKDAKSKKASKSKKGPEEATAAVPDEEVDEAAATAMDEEESDEAA